MGLREQAPSTKPLLGVLSSHSGTNLQAIVDACRDGRLDASVRVVINNNSKATAIQRAKREGIPSYHLSRKTHALPESLDRAILDTLERHEVSLVLLAGYMKLLGPRTLSRYRDRVLNSHPALLPRFGGKGMYGMRVHEAVLAAGERSTGVTIHIVDHEYDHGPTVAQCELPVLDDDDVESLADRVLSREHELWVETLQNVSRGAIDLDEIAKQGRQAERA